MAINDRESPESSLTRDIVCKHHGKSTENLGKAEPFIVEEPNDLDLKKMVLYVVN